MALLDWTLHVLPGHPFRARGWGGTPTPAPGLLAEGTGLSAGGASQQVVSLVEALPWPGPDPPTHPSPPKEATAPQRKQLFPAHRCPLPSPLLPALHS